MDLPSTSTRLSLRPMLSDEDFHSKEVGDIVQALPPGSRTAFKRLPYLARNFYIAECLRREKAHYYQLPWKRRLSCLTIQEKESLGVATDKIPSLSDLCLNKFRLPAQIFNAKMTLFKVLTEFPSTTQFYQNTYIRNRHQMEFMEAALRRSDYTYGQINLLSFREEVYRHQFCVNSPTGSFLDVAHLDNSQLSNVLHLYARLPVTQVSQLSCFYHVHLNPSVSCVLYGFPPDLLSGVHF